MSDICASVLTLIKYCPSRDTQKCIGVVCNCSLGKMRQCANEPLDFSSVEYQSHAREICTFLKSSKYDPVTRLPRAFVDVISGSFGPFIYYFHLIN